MSLKPQNKEHVDLWHVISAQFFFDYQTRLRVKHFPVVLKRSFLYLYLILVVFLLNPAENVPIKNKPSVLLSFSRTW